MLIGYIMTYNPKSYFRILRLGYTNWIQYVLCIIQNLTQRPPPLFKCKLFRGYFFSANVDVSKSKYLI